MYSELDLFLILALSATWNRTDEGIIDTLDRLSSIGKVDPNNNLVKTIRNAQSPLGIVLLALQHFEPEGYQEA
jgi:hypothetical protein